MMLYTATCGAKASLKTTINCSLQFISSPQHNHLKLHCSCKCMCKTQSSLTKTIRPLYAHAHTTHTPQTSSEQSISSHILIQTHMENGRRLDPLQLLDQLQLQPIIPSLYTLKRSKQSNCFKDHPRVVFQAFDKASSGIDGSHAWQRDSGVMTTLLTFFI